MAGRSFRRGANQERELDVAQTQNLPKRYSLTFGRFGGGGGGRAEKIIGLLYTESGGGWNLQQLLIALPANQHHRKRRNVFTMWSTAPPTLVPGCNNRAIVGGTRSDRRSSVRVTTSDRFVRIWKEGWGRRPSYVYRDRSDITLSPYLFVSLSSIRECHACTTAKHVGFAGFRHDVVLERRG